MDARAGPSGQGTVYFAGFRYDTDSSLLWRGATEVPLRPRVAAVLTHLVGRAGELVTKRELLDAVWPEGFVGEGALSMCISELRHALGDDHHQPRFIATAHRRGYRFMPAVSTVPPVGQPDDTGPTLVGRGDETGRLEAWWMEALTGRRQVVLVAGEAGIGKTTLVDAFVAAARARGPVIVGSGRCMEQFGEGEPYLPVFEALSEVCRGPAGGTARDTLATVAPTWLRQLPALVGGDEMEMLERRTLGAPATRMLREIADALDEIASAHPLLVVVEDLHDADPSTVDLIAYLARRSRPAALAVLVTYRPAEMAGRSWHGVVRDLRGRRLCRHLSLGPLDLAAVTDYLATRLAPARPTPDLADEIFSRTEGNPLFLATIVDYLVERALLTDAAGKVRGADRLDRLGVPGSLRQLIDRQIDHADPDDQVLLRAAAVAGVEFSTDVVAASLGGEQQVTDVEERCERLVTHTGIIARSGAAVLPDGTPTTCYRFGHSLYREVLYDHHLSLAPRAELHRRIGERMAATHGPDYHGVAAEMAMHFARGGATAEAVDYLRRAAEAALERSAYAEARDHTGRALQLVERIPTGPERRRLEVELLFTEAGALAAALGFQAPEVEQAYRLAGDLAADLDEKTRVTALYRLGNVLLERGEIAAAAPGAAELLAYAHSHDDPTMLLLAHNDMGFIELCAGEPRRAVEHMERALELYDPAEHSRLAVVEGEEPGVLCRCYGAQAWWLLGHPDRARRLLAEAIELAERLGIPHAVADATSYAVAVEQLCGDATRVATLADDLCRFGDETHMAMWSILGDLYSGWALAGRGEPEEGAARLEKAIAALDDEGVVLCTPYYRSLLATAQEAAGDITAALTVVDGALVTSRRTGERWFDAELLRQRAALLAPSDAEAATAAIGEALRVARRQKARSLELRVATTLALRWSDTGPLTTALEGVTEGYDTVDVRRALAVVAAL